MSERFFIFGGGEVEGELGESVEIFVLEAVVGELVSTVDGSKMLVVSAGGDEAEFGVEEDIDSEGRGTLGFWSEVIIIGPYPRIPEELSHDFF